MTSQPNQSKKIVVQSPTRVDLAGGTLDCWPINAMLSPVTTINLAISIYTQCELTPRDDNQIRLKSEDINCDVTFSSLDELLGSDDPKVDFFREHISFWSPKMGFELETRSQSPVGGGLGGSSSLSISVFKAFNEWLDAGMEREECIYYCAGIEAKILKMPTGTQDYIPAFQGGLNIIDYLAGVPSIERLSASEFPFADRMTLFYTGRSHHSGINNWSVLKSFIDGDSHSYEKLWELKEIAHDFRKAIQTKKFDSLSELFKREYQARSQLAKEFTSPEIEKINAIANQFDGAATKICGAGGGGCVFVWTREEDRQAVVEQCRTAGFQDLPVEFV